MFTLYYIVLRDLKDRERNKYKVSWAVISQQGLMSE